MNFATPTRVRPRPMPPAALTVMLTGVLALQMGCGETSKPVPPPPPTNSVTPPHADDFKIPNYQGDVLRSVLSGKSAVMVGDTNFLQEARVEWYSYPAGKQTLDVVVESPSCIYDMKDKVGTSTNTISIRKTDGKFTTTGVGWEFSQTNSHLTIRRHVHTVIVGDFTPPTPAKSKP